MDVCVLMWLRLGSDWTGSFGCTWLRPSVCLGAVISTLNLTKMAQLILKKYLSDRQSQSQEQSEDGGAVAVT